ncbi:Shedu immune nuclease family protein, partial [Plantactinospora siamensis]
QARCSHLHLTTKGEARVDIDTLYISLSDFDLARSECDRIAARANTAALNVKVATAANWLAGHLGTESMQYKRGRHPMIQRFADASAGQDGLDEEDTADLLALMEQNVDSISSRRPGAVAKLRRDIELVQLDGLIDRFETMLTASHNEEAWQSFFTENPFILTFAFGYPMILVQDQAVAGGRKISGSGEKIADFISKNPTTNNVAIIEIKKPDTSLLQRTEYRRGVYGPSKELTGSITQILDQRYQLVSEFASMQRASRIFDIESFAVQLCLVVGRTPTNPDEAKSFELFRDSLATIEIVTFDELLERVRLLRSFLAD